MKKAEVVLVGPNESSLASSIQNLNFSNADLVAVMTEKIADENSFNLGEQSIPHVSFSSVKEILDRHGDCLWLICGYVNGVEDIRQAKQSLMTDGVAQDRIVDFELAPQNLHWLANMHYVETNGADFFATGDSQMELGLDLNYFPHAPGRGVNLSSPCQSLQQSYDTAKHVFEHVAPKTIKFVLIGLNPSSFYYDNTLPSNHSDLLSDEVRKNLSAILAVDVNFDRAKGAFQRHLPEETLSALNGDKNLAMVQDIDEHSRILEEYIKLCRDNGAKPICVVFPVEPTFRKSYNAVTVKRFRQTVNQFKKKYGFLFIDLFDVRLPTESFHDEIHLNAEGATAVSALLGERLCIEKIIPVKSIYDMGGKFFYVLYKYFPGDYTTLTCYAFCRTACDDFKRLSATSPKDECKDLMANIFSEMTYNHLVILSDMLSKEDYNDLAARVFEISAEKIRRKDKIKVGFVTYDSSIWCGDELYNFFAADERFESTIFLCLRTDKAKDEIVKKDFWHGVEQFRRHGLNVVALDKRNSSVPAQDVLIFLTPYLNVLPLAFRLVNLSLETLTTYINYGFNTAKYFADSYPVAWTAWKNFLALLFSSEIYEKRLAVGMPRGIYSGYSRMDIFFKPDAKFQFDWKMTRPDAKKIIWAPHWSITGGINYATFQWNYQFMYEFAKAHPEISWVVKPHPNLLFSAVRQKVFPSPESFKGYLQKWDELPNAQVYTGAYYQDIFATSDGMIHDSSSFIAEYQYVDKPMIYLTRDTQKFNKLGNEILKASYTVEGKDLDAIAAMMQRVFIEGDDYKAAERRKVFDEYLNYPKYLGMLASEFIYKDISQALKG